MVLSIYNTTYTHEDMQQKDGYRRDGAYFEYTTLRGQRPWWRWELRKLIK